MRKYAMPRETYGRRKPELPPLDLSHETEIPAGGEVPAEKPGQEK